MSRGNAPKEKESYKLPILPRQYTILSAEQVAAGRKSEFYKMEITGIHNLGLTVCDHTYLTSLFLNDNYLVRIPSAISKLVNLKELDLSNNSLHTIPPELGDLTNLEQLFLSNNQLRTLPYELGKLFNMAELTLQGNPLPADLLNVFLDPNGGTHKLLTFMLNNLVERTHAPEERQWVTINDSTLTKPVCQFSVMCYNVLCSKYATRQMYGYCPPWALSWDYRKKGIISEIRKYDSDIITLQEVETDAFHNFFSPELKAAGYDGIFSPKSRAKHMHEKEKKFVDGCAIFYKSIKFALVKEHLIEFNQLAMANHDGSEDMLNRVMPKDNIGLAALLHTKPGAWSEYSVPPEKSIERQSLLVCTAHIHWDPEYCDVKLIQTIMLMTEIRKIAQTVTSDEGGGRGRQQHRGQDPSGGVHLLLCGDLNSLPESGVVEFLSNGQVPMDHRDFKGHGYKNTLHKLTISKGGHHSNSNVYTHNFRLRPAYENAIMPYTNYTHDFKGIIDYIFHSSDTMMTVAALGPIDPAWFKENKIVGCPHPHVPSDHFPLVVQLELWPFGSSMLQHQQAAANALKQYSNLSHHHQQHHLQQQQHHHQSHFGGHHPNMSGPGIQHPHKNNGNNHR